MKNKNSFLIGCIAIGGIFFILKNPIVSIAVISFALVIKMGLRDAGEKKPISGIPYRILDDRNEKKKLLDEWAKSKNLKWNWMDNFTCSNVVLTTEKGNVYEGNVYFKYDKDFPRVSLFKGINIDTKEEVALKGMTLPKVSIESLTNLYIAQLMDKREFIESLIYKAEEADEEEIIFSASSYLECNINRSKLKALKSALETMFNQVEIIDGEKIKITLSENELF